MVLREIPGVPSVTICSSLCLDTIAAAHLLIDPSHHGFASEWVQTLRRNLVPSAVKALDVLSVLPFQCLELSNTSALGGELDDVDGFIDLLSGMSGAEFVYWLFQQRVPLNTIQECLDRQRQPETLCLQSGPGHPSREWIRSALTSAGRFQAAVCELFSALARPVAEMRASLNEFYSSIVEALSDKLAGHPGGLVGFAADHWEECQPVGSNSAVYCLIISWFSAPHRLYWSDLHRIFVVPDWQEVGCGLESDRAQRLKKLAGALADANRLVIMRELARARRSGRALAPRLGLTPATMAHHLGILVSAGLVVREEVGNVHFYSTDLGAIDAAVREIKDYLTYSLRSR